VNIFIDYLNGSWYRVSFFLCTMANGAISFGVYCNLQVEYFDRLTKFN
jgi:hypothetical protein